jgi:pyruvate kinase
MNYEIIATLGPGSQDPALWASMLASGVTAFRLNTSHLSLAQTLDWLDRLDAFFRSASQQVPVVLDLQGSKWRLGQTAARTLSNGELVELVCASAASQPDQLPVPHPDFFKAAPASNGEIVLNDAKVRLRIERMSEDGITAWVTQAGEIAAHKGITLTDSAYRHESLNEKDQSILAQTKTINFIRYAISYVRDAAEMAAYRARLGSAPFLIAKLERRQAMQEASEMAGAANELWVCRGDLGAELGLPALAETVFRFAPQVRQMPVPVIMAGQVLEHMTRQPTPTRSEVCYLYETLQKGYQGFVLSDETAIGQYPLESCQTAALFKS